MTQAALADALGVPQSWVSNIESGARKIEVVELIDIALALGKEPTELMREISHEA